MKIGVKTFSNYEYLKHFEKDVDFFEVQAIESVNYDFLKKITLPIVIHAQHQSFNINLADKKLSDINRSSVEYAKKIADMAKSNKIIQHPGALVSKDCSIETAIDFIDSIPDKRILIENLIPKEKGLCCTPEETKDFLKMTNRRFIFDINHAIESAVFYKKDYMEMIKQFLELRPMHFHIGGQIIEKGITHIGFYESTIPIKEILALFPKDAEITLETTTDIKETEYDVKFIRKIIDELGI